MTATVTLSWDDPEDADQFLDLHGRLRRDGWLPDPSADALRELTASASAVTGAVVWHVVQSLCPGGEHDDLPCEGGEWRDEMSLAWFSEPGRQAEALALFREDPEGGRLQFRMVRRTETVLGKDDSDDT